MALSILKTCVAMCTRSKKPILIPPLQIKRRSIHWISPSALRNYFLNDPFADILKERYKKSSQKQESFASFLMKKGNEFEAYIINELINLGHPIVTVGTEITDENCSRTKQYMKEGVPIIYSAPVRNYKNRTHGVIDLLVRSDYLDNIFIESPLPIDVTSISAPNLKLSHHYVVIDIKYSRIHLTSSNIVSNAGSNPYFKGQLWLYTQAIGQIQGYTSPYALLLGRTVVRSSDSNTDTGFLPLKRAAIVNFDKEDSYIVLKTLKAINWIRELKQTKSWALQTIISKKNIYPNMCVDSGYLQPLKTEIANNIGEITLLWNCGPKHRTHAMERGINSIHDLSSSSQLGIKGSYSEIIDKILDVNKPSNKNVIWPNKIHNDLYDWKTNLGHNEAFIDFETITSACNITMKTDMIFLIGIGWKNKENKWNQHAFTIKSMTRDSEIELLKTFIFFVYENKFRKLWYWHAEKSILNRKLASFPVHISFDITLADLCSLFKETPIVLKGCYNFSLKNIVSAMSINKLICTTYSDRINSGTTAMIEASKLLINSSAHKDPWQTEIMQDVILYNQTDCMVLSEILQYLRQNHA